MASRASIYAVVILLVTLGVVFVLVGDSGVSTGVYLADHPTDTPAPTAGPSPTPLPDPAAGNWSETVPGQLVYTARPESSAQIAHSTSTLNAFVQGMGLETPVAGNPYPALSALETLRDGFEKQVAQLGLTAGPDTFDGPSIELVNGVPVSRLRVRLDAQPNSQGGQFPGLDLLIGVINRPDDQIEIVQYRLQETPDPAIYRDFRAWLEANVVELSGAAEVETGADAAETPGAAEATPAEETQDEEASAEETPVAVAPAEETAAVAEEPEGAPETAANEETAGETAEETAEASSEGPWTEVAEGVLMYTADPMLFAQIAHRSMPVAEFVAGSGLSAPAESTEAPVLDLLTQLRETFARQLAAQGLTLADDAFTGPDELEIAGRPAARLRFTAPAQTPENGQPFPGLDMEVILVDAGEGQLAAIQYTYQGAPENSVYDAYATWLEENAARVTALAPAQGTGADAAQDPAGETGGD